GGERFGDRSERETMLLVPRAAAHCAVRRDHGSRRVVHRPLLDQSHAVHAPDPTAAGPPAEWLVGYRARRESCWASVRVPGLLLIPVRLTSTRSWSPARSFP